MGRVLSNDFSTELTCLIRSHFGPESRGSLRDSVATEVMSRYLLSLKTT